MKEMTLRSRALSEVTWRGKATIGRYILLLGLLAIVATFLIMFLAAKPAHAVPNTFTVNQTGNAPDADLNDSVCDTNLETIPRGLQCTLRAAIQEANNTPNSQEPDLIKFNIPGLGPHTIQPPTALPTITEAVTIDGYTEGDLTTNTADDDAKENALKKGTNAVLKIELDGSSASGSVSGLQIAGGGTTVRGLVINNFNNNGIQVLDTTGNENIVIEGNFIGTNLQGDLAEPNGSAGVVVLGGIDHTVGGTTLAARNLISGNRFGVELDSDDSIVRGNLIGTDKSGAANLRNDTRGIGVFGSNNDVTNNVVAFSLIQGVIVSGSTSTANNILRNSIFSNGGLGIDLGANGPTGNDTDDNDSGPNGLQNKPQLTSATTTGTIITIVGVLDSKPSTSYTVEFFSNGNGDEGKKFIKRKLVNADQDPDGNGLYEFTFQFNKAVAAGQKITATATGPEGTSEFSATVEAAASS